MTVIRPEEIKFSKLSLADDVGQVFGWNGGIYRGIHAAAASQVRDLFASGVLDELNRRGLFPRSEITEHTLEGFAFSVKHETVPFVTYPHEWSFDMFRDAALAALEVSEVAARYGWSLKDCHPYNVLFNGVRPLFVDLGSFVPATSGTGFGPGAEFLSCYWRPLAIWASGDYFLAQRIISSAHESMPTLSWRFYRNQVMRSLGPRLGSRIARRWEDFASRVAGRLRDGQKLPRKIAPLATCLPAEFVMRNTDLLRRKIARLVAPAPTSFWHNYHDENLGPRGPVSTPRFDQILDIIRSLGCDSVTELAGNQGLLSLLILSKTPVRRVVCTDYDVSAVNRLYHCCRSSVILPTGKTMHPAVVNLMIPEMNFHTTPPAERLRSDLVTALAVTHHLTLSQKFPLREVIRNIAAYTRRFALVEFMPLGLWNGTEAPPVPVWYTSEWFLRGFSEFFDVILVKEVETNRLLHLGRLRSS